MLLSAYDSMFIIDYRLCTNKRNGVDLTSGTTLLEIIVLVYLTTLICGKANMVVKYACIS